MYPILNLRYHKEDLHWYFRSLEEVIICALKSAFFIKASRVEGLTGVWVGMNYPLGNFKYLAKFPFFSPFIVSLKSYNACKINCAVGSLMNPLHFLSRGSKSCSDRDSWHPDDSLPWSSTKRHNWLSPLQTDWSLRHKGSRCWEH